MHILCTASPQSNIHREINCSEGLARACDTKIEHRSEQRRANHIMQEFN